MRPGRLVARRGWALASALCSLTFVAGCGSPSPAAISASSASTLHRDVQRIRLAAAARNARQAHTAVAALRGDVARLLARHELATSDAHVLLIEASQVDARAAIELKPVSAPATSQPTAVSPTTPSPGKSPAAPSVGKGDGHGHGHGKGHGHGHGGGQGGD
jgi:hypothetical protein